MRHNRNDYVIDQSPALRAEHLPEGRNAAVLTIASVRSGNIPDREAPGGQRFTTRIKFEEFPDNQFYVNPAGMTALIETYGEDDHYWIGREVPLIIKDTENPKTGAKVKALHVAPLSEWKGLLEGTGEVEESIPPAARKNATKKAATKRAR